MTVSQAWKSQRDIPTVSGDWKDTMGLPDISEITGAEGERQAKKEQAKQRSMLRKQQEKEKLRLMEAEDEISRRAAVQKMGGRQSLLGG